MMKKGNYLMASANDSFQLFQVKNNHPSCPEGVLQWMFNLRTLEVSGLNRVPSDLANCIQPTV